MSHLVAAPRAVRQLREWRELAGSIARALSIAMAAGAIAGVVVGGIGGRIAMRISAIAAGDSARGMITDNENVVGDITLGGTIGVIIFGGLFIGIAGGLLYAVLQPWLPGRGARKGLAFGLLLLLALGFAIIEGGNRDFHQFGPAPLNILLFAALFPLYGLLIAPLAEAIDRGLPPGSFRAARPAGRAAMSVGVAVAVLITGQILSIVVVTAALDDDIDTRLATLVFLYLLLVLPLAPSWLLPRLAFSGSLTARRMAIFRLSVLALPLALGLFLDVLAVTEILQAEY